jgi:hypothetical protein
MDPAVPIAIETGDTSSMAPEVAAAIIALVGGALGWAYKTWHGRRNAADLDAAGGSIGDFRAAARDVRAELRDIRADIAAARRYSGLANPDLFPVTVFTGHRQTLMKAASTDQGDTVEEAYRRVRLLRQHVGTGTRLPVAELQAADDAVNAALNRLDELEEALKKRGGPRLGSAAVAPRRDRRRT